MKIAISFSGSWFSTQIRNKVEMIFANGCIFAGLNAKDLKSECIKYNLNIICLGCYARLFGTAGYRGTQSNVWTDESEEFKTTSIKIKGKTPISGIPAVIGVTSEACIRCTDSVSIS